MAKTDFNPRWRWSNCRDLSLSLHFLIFPWHFGFEITEEVYGGWRSLIIGPIGISMHYGIGNCSTGGFWARFALSEDEAWARAVAAEVREGR